MVRYQEHVSSGSHGGGLHNATQPTWRSPVPYLFGGVAAMLALIAVALLILACSYWKLSGRFSGAGASAAVSYEGDVAEKKGGVQGSEGEVDKEIKFVVIMAGELQPTFLAKPAFIEQQNHHQQQHVDAEDTV